MAEQIFHPELRAVRFLPKTTVTPRNLRIVRLADRLIETLQRSKSATVARVNKDVSVRVFRPTHADSVVPALLWIHGGGMVIGTAAQDDKLCQQFAQELGIVVASVDYRLSPEHPFPVPLEDCYAALEWLVRQPGVDITRVAIGGASAGGGLAASLALLARDRGEISLTYQLLTYPMLDDRSALRVDIDRRRLRLWDQSSNAFGWRSYLGPANIDRVPPLAAPARYEDLAGLPSAWIGVGTNDLFHDEDVAYAHRLRQSGVPCELHIADRAYHSFDIVERKTPIAQAFRAAQLAALRHAFRQEAAI